MSLFYVLAYRNERDSLVDVARIDGGVKKDAIRRIAQKVATDLGQRIEVRKTDVAVPMRGAPAAPRAGRRINPARKARAKRNPARRERASAPAADRAKKTFRKWHQFDPKGVVRAQGSRSIPAQLVKLGEIPEIVYRSDKWTGKQETYLHKTGRPRPLLCTDPDGKRLFIIGGRVRVTERGLVG